MTEINQPVPIPSLQIILVLYNSGSDLNLCLDALACSLNNINYRLEKVTLIDNTPHNPPDLKPWLVRLPLDYVAAKQNLGFGKACNLAANRSQSDYILFLNPDCFVNPSAIGNCILHLTQPSNVKTAVTSVLLKSKTGEIQKTCARFPNLKMFINESLGVDRLNFISHNSQFYSHHMKEWNHDESKFVEHVIGAFYLIRRSVFTFLNGFDERFFVYLEDLDLSLRVHQAGYQIYFLTNDYAIHKGGGSSESVKAFRLCLSLESKIKYADKHFSFWQKWTVIIIIFSFEFLLRSLYALKTNPSKNTFKEIFHAYQLLFNRLKTDPKNL